MHSDTRDQQSREEAGRKSIERFGHDFCNNYDINAPEIAEHWEDVVDFLHSRCPIARSEIGEGYWVLNDYEDVRLAGKDWETFSSADGFVPNRPEGMPFWYPVDCDPPLATELRTILDPYLSPKAVAAHEPEVRALAETIADRLPVGGEVDLMAEYCSPIPAEVFCRLVAGIPQEDVPGLVQNYHDGRVGPIEGRAKAMQDAQDYMELYLRNRKDSSPKGDMVDAILAIDIPGYGWSERVGTLSLLALGGLATTSHVIGCGALHFAKHPTDAERFMDEPSIRPRAIEEFIRAYAPSPHDGRRVRKDVEVGGVALRKGDYVLLGYGAACRDPKVNPDPKRIKFDRMPNRHLAFGSGPHRCIGAHLARLELRVAFEVLLDRYPTIEIKPDFTPLYESEITRSLMSLPVRLMS